MAVSRIRADQIDAEGIAFGIAPRINAVGRVGEALPAARLLLAEDPSEAAALAAEVDAANTIRRGLLTIALAEARAEVDTVAESGLRATVVAGAWPVGIIGLVAGRLAEDLGRPAVVFSTLAEPWRGSARSAGGFDLASAFTACGDLFERFGGHAAAAGCHMPSARYAAFRERFMALLPPELALRARPTLRIDLVLRAESVDYVLCRELAALADWADPPPLVGIEGFVVGRVRAAAGGHTQLTLRKGNEVLDAICFGRPDLAESVGEGQTVDLVARLASRSFGGHETLQLEVRDVASAGRLANLWDAARSTAGPSGAPVGLQPPRRTDLLHPDAMQVPAPAGEGTAR